jgi:hypothetical protein
MGSNVNYTMTHGIVSSTGSAPLSASYKIAGGTEAGTVDQILSIGTNQLVSIAYGPSGTSSGNLQACEIISSQNCTIVTNGTATADVQTVSISGTPTGGTFVLAYGGQITAPIAYNAAASAVQSALQALSSIGSGNITCTGGALPGTAVVCTFSGTLATGLKSLIVPGNGGFTGGSSPLASVVHSTPGLPQDTLTISANVPVIWDIQSSFACPFAAAVTAWYVTCAGTIRLQARALTL